MNKIEDEFSYENFDWASDNFGHMQIGLGALKHGDPSDIPDPHKNTTTETTDYIHVHWNLFRRWDEHTQIVINVYDNYIEMVEDVNGDNEELSIGRTVINVDEDGHHHDEYTHESVKIGIELHGHSSYSYETTNTTNDGPAIGNYKQLWVTWTLYEFDAQESKVLPVVDLDLRASNDPIKNSVDINSEKTDRKDNFYGIETSVYYDTRQTGENNRFIHHPTWTNYQNLETRIHTGGVVMMTLLIAIPITWLLAKWDSKRRARNKGGK